MRLGEAHCPGPYTLDEIRQVLVANLLGRGVGQAVVSTATQLGIQLECNIGCAEDLVDQALQCFRQTLAAVVRVGVDAGPAGLDELFIGLFEARGCRDVAVVKRGAMLVALAVDRQQLGAGEFSRLLEDGFDQVEVDFLVTGQGIKAVDTDPVADEKEHVLNGCVVNHNVSVSKWCAVLEHEANPVPGLYRLPERHERLAFEIE